MLFLTTFHPRFEVWSEASYLFGGPNKIYDWQHLKGYRFILQTPVLYQEKQHVLYCTGFPVKSITPITVRGHSLISTIGDTLNNFPYEGSQVLIGGAFCNRFPGYIVPASSTLFRNYRRQLAVKCDI
jgi:hypothetical protein